MATILAIESSCDDTAAAVWARGAVRSNAVSSQAEHEAYGGVVPELASRAHQVHIGAVVNRALATAGLRADQLDAVAYTAGPGLMGSLLVGASFAKAFASAQGLPLLAVDHLYAHLRSVFIEAPRPAYPLLTLTVSGGHTQLSLQQDALTYSLIGQTQDDAAGEAFDKIAQLLGLGYPGGPAIDRHARAGDPARWPFSPAQMPAYDFSFSGLKTAVLYFLRAKLDATPDFVEQNRSDLCAGIQAAILTSLLEKLWAAAEAYAVQEVAIVGGVSANAELRQRFYEGCRARGLNGYIPDVAYCTDNAAMVAEAAQVLYEAGRFADPYARPYPSGQTAQG